MANVLDEVLMKLLEKIQPQKVSVGSYSPVQAMGCGCTGNCGQSCAGGCEAGCSGNCGRSCSGSGS